MIISGEVFKSQPFNHNILPVYRYKDIIMKLEEEEEEEAEEIEDLKEKQKRLKEEMLKKRRPKRNTEEE